MSERAYGCWATLIAFVSLWARSYGFYREPWLDEIYSLNDSSLSWEHLSRGDHPLLFHVVLGALNPNDSVVVARILMLAIALLTCVAFLWATKPLGREGSLLGLIFLMGNPLLINYGIEIRMYGLLVLITCLVLREIRRIQTSPASLSNYRLLIAWLVLATQTHAVGIFLAPAALLALLLAKRENRPGVGLSATLILIPLASLLVWMWAYQMRYKLSHTSWIEYPSPGVVFQHIADLTVTGRISAPELAIAGAGLLIAVFCLAGLGEGGSCYLAGGLLYFIQVLVFSLLLKPILIARTLLPVIPFLAAFLAVRYQSVLQRARLSRAILLLLLTYSTCNAVHWIAYESQTCPLPMKDGLTPVAATLHPDDYLVVDWALGPIPQFYFPEHPSERVKSLNPRNPQPDRLPAPGTTVYLILWIPEDGKALPVQGVVSKGRSEKLLFESPAILIYRYLPLSGANSTPENPPPNQ